MNRDGNTGFTLLEVLVALALVAVAAAGMMALSNDLFRLVGDSRDRDSLALLAREAAHRHAADMRHPARKDGQCEPPDEDCRWSAVTEPTGEPGLALVRLTVDCGGDRTLTIERVASGSGG